MSPTASEFSPPASPPSCPRKRASRFWRRPGGAAAAPGIALLIALAASAAGPARAADDGDDERDDRAELPDIVVTAQKQARTLEETAASISSLDGDFMREVGARSFADLQDYTANVSLSLSHAAGTFAIRGFATPDTNPGFDPSVGAVIDGVYYGRPQFLAAFFHDVDRFEVLRGPQGTLFGKNCTAGIFNVVTRAPAAEWRADAELLYDDYGERSIKPALSAPLGGGFSLRLAGDYTTSDDGSVYNTYLRRPEGDTHSRSTRLRLHFDSGSPLQADLMLFRSDDRFNNSTFQFARLTDAMRQLVQSYDPQADDNAADFRNSANLEARNVAVIDGGSLTLDYDFADAFGIDELRLTSITAGAQSKTTRLDLDADFSPVPFIHDVLAEPKLYKQLSQELRVSGDNESLFGWGRRFSFVAGLYYARTEFHTSDIFALENLGGAAQYCSATRDFCGQYPGFPSGAGGTIGSLLGGGTGLLTLSDIVNAQTEQHAQTLLHQSSPTYAVFGSFEHYIFRKWAIIGGLRFSRETKDGLAHAEHQGELIPRLAAEEDHTTPIHRSEHDLSPKAGLKWQPDAETEIYWTWAQGYKSGGFNGLPLNQVNLEYDPELATSYEIGAKKRSTFLGGPVRVSFSAFNTDFDDLQVSTFINGGFVVLNAASARSRGFEMDLNWLPPLPGLSLYSSLGFADARYKEYRDAPPLSDAPAGTQTQDLSGRPLSLAPRWTASVVPAWRVPLFERVDATVAVDWLYRSERYLDVDDDPRKLQPATRLVNARLTFDDAQRRWAVTIGGHNLTNVLTYDQVIGQPLAPGNFVAFRTDRGRYYSVALALSL